MASLEKTLAGLRLARRAASPGSINGRLTALPDFGPNPGALAAHIHVPSRLSRRPALVVVLHGCTQSAAVYDQGSGWSALADREGFIVLYPEQTRGNNPNLCFNWFVPADVARKGGEAESIHHMIDTVVAAHGVDPERIFVTGLSAGGAMAASLLASYPDVFAAGAIIAGLPHGVAQTIPEAFERMRGKGLPGRTGLETLRAGAAGRRKLQRWPRISVWTGSADQTVAPVNAAAIVAQWQGVHGVADAPDTRETIDGARRRTWRSDGEVRIEMWEITGLGHGTPIDPAGDGLGQPLPYMLPAGISSTAHIARFFGVMRGAEQAASDGAAAERRQRAPTPAPQPAEPPPVSVAPADSTVHAQEPDAPGARPATTAIFPVPDVIAEPVRRDGDGMDREPDRADPPPPPPGVVAYVNQVIDQALPGNGGLFGSIKQVIAKAMERAGLR